MIRVQQSEIKYKITSFHIHEQNQRGNNHFQSNEENAKFEKMYQKKKARKEKMHHFE